MADICVFRDDAKNCIVLKDGEKVFTFTPEQWAVICMAANSDMENRLYAVKRCAWNVSGPGKRTVTRSGGDDGLA